MMASAIQFALERSRFTVFVMVGLLITGMSLYVNFPKREDPEILVRVAVVTVEFPGMTPQRLEELIAGPVERKIREIPEVDEISTRLTSGRMSIHVQLKDQVTKLEPIWQTLRDKMEDVTRELPSGSRGPFVNSNFGDVAIATIALTAEGYDYREMEVTAQELQRRLYQIAGVAKVDLYGVQEERVWLEVDADRLASIGLQINQLIGDLQSQNVVLPAGTLNANGTKILLEASGDFETIEEIGNLLTKVQGLDDFIRLQDLISVRRGFVSPMQKPVFFDERPSIVISVQMQSSSDIRWVGRDLRAQVEGFEATLPIGYELNFATFQPDDVTRAINGAVRNVSQTLAVVLVIMILFLGLRSGLVIASLIPFAVMFALIGMRLLGIDLEQISIAAVIISLGLLVDNGVVVVEDIIRRVSEGQSRAASALAAGKQFSVPLGVSSLTTIFAFLPFFLLEGSEGEYSFSLGAVVALTLSGSWIASLFFLPLISSWSLKGRERLKSEDKGESRLVVWTDRYANLLGRFLKRPGLVILVCYGAVVGSILLLGAVPRQMFPESDRAQVLVYMDMPNGTHIDETRDRAFDVSAWLADETQNPEVLNQILYVGDGGPRFYLSLSPADPGSSVAFFLVNTHDHQGASRLARRAQRYFYEHHPEARFKIKRLSMGASESGLVEIELKGPDLDRLMSLAKQVETVFQKAPDLVQNESDWGNKIVRVLIDLDQDRLRRVGLTSESSSQLLSAYFDGLQISDYREEDQSIPILLRASEANRDSLEDLLNIVLNGDGQLVSLEQVAVLRPTLDYSQIRRMNQSRTIKVTAKSNGMTADQLLSFVSEDLDRLDLSGGYQMIKGGEAAKSGEINGKLAMGLPIAFTLMALAIVFQFNSFRRTLVVFMTIPLILIGVPYGLLLFQQPMSFFGTLGIISLAGIVINNAIVLIDQIDIELKRADMKEAIMVAAHKRMRPILLTSATTVLGLTPLYLFGGALWSPLAVVMISGLAVASLVTLFFVPASYLLMLRKN